MPTPPADIWVQYSVVGIVVVATLLIAGAFYKLFLALLAWQDKQEKARAAERASQDAKRDEERKTQREWEAAQAKARDEQWQKFLGQMQERWIDSDKQNADVIRRLIEKVDELTVSMINHDTYVRASGGSASRPAARRKRSES